MVDACDQPQASTIQVTRETVEGMTVPEIPASEVKLIAFACEAGVGSSLMGANQLKKLIKKAKLDITVIHCPVSQLPDNVDVVVTHTGLANQARARKPDTPIVPFQMFINDPAVKGLVATLAAGENVVG